MLSKYNLKTLPNGLRIVTIPMNATDSVTAFLIVGAGTRCEDEKNNGISHFLEHIVFKGTKKYKTALALSTAVDSVGAEFNAFTDKESTGFYVKAAKKHLDLALQVLSELVFYPLIREADIRKEKGVIVEEINMYDDQPMAKVGKDFETLLYKDTPLGFETIGTKENVVKMTQKDFFSYRKRYYVPERMILGIAGAIPKLQGSSFKVQALIERYFFSKKHFGSVKRSSDSLRKKVKKNIIGSRGLVSSPCLLARPAGGSVGRDLRVRQLADQETSGVSLTFSQEKPAVFVRRKKTAQSHFCLGVRAFKRTHKERYSLAVMSAILGGGMSSRLFTEVREKRGLAYYVSTSVGTFYDNGYLVTQAGVDKNKISKAIEVILSEYRKVTSYQLPVTSKELRKAKEYLKGRFILSLENSKAVAALFAENLLLEGKVRLPDEIMKKIDAVTLADVRRVAKKVFVDDGLNLSVVGPYKDKGRFEKLLRF